MFDEFKNKIIHKGDVMVKLKLGTVTDKILKVLDDVLYDVAMDHAERAAQIVVSSGHTFTGRLKNDIDAIPMINKDYIGVVGILPATNHHGAVIHEGRRPGSRMPPYKPISKWVARKLGIPVDDKKHYPIVQSIRRNIGAHGMKSLPAGGLQYFTRAMLERRRTYEGWINDALSLARSD